MDEAAAEAVTGQDKALHLHHHLSSRRESVEALCIFGGILLWGALIAPFARAVWHHFRGHPLPSRPR